MANRAFLKPYAGRFEGDYAEGRREGEELRPVAVELVENNYGVEIRVDGYGCMGVHSAGCIHIELDPDTNELRLTYWPDINEESSVDVDLSGAAIENDHWGEEEADD